MRTIIKFFKFTFILLLIFGWVFNYPPINFGGQGWPQIFNPSTLFRTGFPPNIQEARAAITHQRMPSEVNIVSPVSINISVAYPDDLIYDGSVGSVGLTREPLLNMKWWRIAVYTETENFVSGCVPTTSPLPTAVLNLGAGDYKTAISLAETKEDCEAFNVAEYPLFAVLEAANFKLNND